MSTEEASPLSPCPHNPACPPPVCLPPSLRPTAATATPVRHDPAGGTGTTVGYETEIGYIEKFAGTMSDSAEGVALVGQRTPRFDGWNLVPLAGVPVVGLMFVNRFNTIADVWSDSAGVLGEVLLADSGKVGRSAANYRQAESAS